LTSLLGLTEREAMEICRLEGLSPAIRRTEAPRAFDGDLWRVVQQRQGADGQLLLLVARFRSQPEEPR